MSTIRFTKNITEKSDAGDIYWRIEHALTHDALCSMLAERTLKGVAAAGCEVLTGTRTGAYETVLPEFLDSGKVYTRILTMLERSPLCFLSYEARQHVAQTVADVLFPEAVS